jgi:two-component system chemotaxis sensor kinase CheA
MAIPLSLVARLEEFPRTAVENLGPCQVVQYLGGILPLVDVSHELESLRLGGRALESTPRNDNASDTVPVVVYVAGDQRVGLVVDQILDIVVDQVAERSRASRPGVQFTAIIQEKVTEFVDVAALIREATIDLLQPTT